jgi:ribbon-helix-helix CopG family protein
MMCCMSATRTQVYLTAEQRAGLDERARVERKTMAHVIRDAVDIYLAADVDGQERERLLADTFGACPTLGKRLPSRDEWDRGLG